MHPNLKPQPSPASPPPLPAAAYAARPGAGSPPPVPGALPNRFIIRVDGVGSFLVLRSPRVTIGPVSSSRMPDVGLVADPGLPVATIERLDDDYFVRAAQLVAVNDRSAVGDAGRLLATGDRVALSPRCRLAFHLPSPASTSAVLELTGSRLPMADVRRVILMDRDLIIGPHAGADASHGSVGRARRNRPAPSRRPAVLRVQGRSDRRRPPDRPPRRHPARRPRPSRRTVLRHHQRMTCYWSRDASVRQAHTSNQ